MSHPVGTLALQPSEPGAASAAPALAHLRRGASVSDRTCSIDGCAKPHYARGMCSTHNWRMRHKGDPHAAGPTGTPYSAPLAFIDLAVASGTDECILWPYAINDNGYGKVNVGGRQCNAHRVVHGGRTGAGLT